tara:strand:+ start:3500 stop:6118 length:2619 start_codon:yes stop_codon:yes gene_type:complete
MPIHILGTPFDTESSLTSAYAEVAVLADGTIVAVQYVDRDSIEYDVFSPDGELISERIIDIDLGPTRRITDIAVRPDGSIVVLNTGDDYYSLQLIGAGGDPLTEVISLFPGNSLAQSIDAAPDGSFTATAVTAGATGAFGDTILARFDAAGAPIGEPEVYHESPGASHRVFAGQHDTMDDGTLVIARTETYTLPHPSQNYSVQVEGVSVDLVSGDSVTNIDIHIPNYAIAPTVPESWQTANIAGTSNPPQAAVLDTGGFAVGYIVNTGFGNTGPTTFVKFFDQAGNPTSESFAVYTEPGEGSTRAGGEFFLVALTDGRVAFVYSEIGDRTIKVAFVSQDGEGGVVAEYADVGTGTFSGSYTSTGILSVNAAPDGSLLISYRNPDPDLYVTARVVQTEAVVSSTLTGTNAGETIDGSALNDLIDAKGGDDVVNGLDGDDTIYGGGGNDTLNGGNGNDSLKGGTGDDTLVGGYGTDSYDGGSGQDTVTFHGNVGWTIDLGGETASVGSIAETLVSIENVVGANGDDHITGSSASNRLFGSDGDDTLVGGAGIDRYYGGSGSDTVNFAGAAGWVIDLAAGTAVTLTGGTTELLDSIENIIGSDGNDRITGTNRANDLYGGGGDDLLDGGGGVDDYYGGAGFDTVDLSGGNSKWRVDLGAGTAELTTATGNVHTSDFVGIESVIGPRNSMTFIGTDGNEKATGSFFADIFYARGGVDEFHGGNGSDTVSFGNYGEGLTIRGTAGYARLGNGTEVTTFTGIENIFATSLDDDITGTSGNNTIVGRDGADKIHGGSGDDKIQGDLGRDLITGGRGNDVIDGGSDPNDYAFFSGNRSQYDISTSGGVTTVAWIGPGAGDGTDTLTNIEFLSFDDGFFSV